MKPLTNRQRMIIAACLALWAAARMENDRYKAHQSAKGKGAA